MFNRLFLLAVLAGAFIALRPLWAGRTPGKALFGLRIADASGHSRWISGAVARKYVHWLRAGFDAIGVGGRTARLDDPQLTPRGSVTPRVPPRRIVTGHDDTGKSVVLSDAPTPKTLDIGTAAFHELLRIALAGGDPLAAVELERKRRHRPVRQDPLRPAPARAEGTTAPAKDTPATGIPAADETGQPRTGRPAWVVHGFGLPSSAILFHTSSRPSLGSTSRSSSGKLVPPPRPGG